MRILRQPCPEFLEFDDGQFQKRIPCGLGEAHYGRCRATVRVTEYLWIDGRRVAKETSVLYLWPTPETVTT